jgi:hypothetical protein
MTHPDVIWKVQGLKMQQRVTLLSPLGVTLQKGMNP